MAMGVKPADSRLAVVRKAAATPKEPAPEALARMDNMSGWLMPMHMPRQIATIARAIKLS